LIVGHRLLTGELRAAAEAVELVASPENEGDDALVGAADPVSQFLVNEFVIESRDLLERLDRDLVQLEREPGSRQLVASIFRGLHTLKGNALCLSFSRVATVTHAAEDVLARVREGEMAVDAALVDALLEVGDHLRRTLDRIHATHVEGDDDAAPLLARLERFVTPPTLVRPSPLAPTLSSPSSSPPSSPGVPMPAQLPEDTAPMRVASLPPETPVRVELRLLQRAAQIAEELGRLRAELEERTSPDRSAELTASLRRLDGVAADLASTVRAARMQPLGGLWLSMPRVVRDVALLCGKKVQLETSGAEVELDRAIVEALRDPLVHLVRNAVDHGIETPASRQAAGKSPVGRLALTARRDRGRVLIVLQDDGRGVDLDRVRRQAFRRGLCALEGGSDLDDREAMELIFLPGFSTAERVTHVSGRGVGLDAVKTRVEQLGGRLEVQSEAGRGTTVRLRFADPSPQQEFVERRARPRGR
jgi:two-component system chemotaxis sensor kinase CheA